MFKSLFPVLSSLFLTATLLTTGCTATPTAASAADSSERELDRNGAIARAVSDASTRYQLASPNAMNAVATRLGAMWVVEVRGGAARGLRYAISARDGSIRETTMIE